MKRPFKVVIQKDNKLLLIEVKGYFTYLKDMRVFIYKDYLYRTWYVIDIDTGMSFAHGHSMVEAKCNAIDKMEALNKIKGSDVYNQCRFNYQRLIKEGIV